MATNTRKLADLLANIDNNSKITTGGLLDATITAADLADDSVGAAEIIDDAVGAAAIADGAIDTAAKLGSNVVTTAKILDNNITGAKIVHSTIDVKPHIEPGVLEPAYRGLLKENTTGRTFTDSSATGHALQPDAGSSVSHTSAKKKIGNTSIRFEGYNKDYFTAPDHSDFAVGTGDFTWEFWINIDGNQTNYTTVLGSINSHFRVSLGPNSSTAPKMSVYGPWGDHTTTTTTLSAGTWYHFAYVRQGTNLRLYVNGTQEATRASSGNSLDPDLIRFGQYTNHTLFFKGHLDEIRFSNNCRYPDGTGFTPSTSAFSPDGNTKLLIHSNESAVHSGAYGTAQSDGLSYYYTDIKGSRPIKDPRIGAQYGSQRHKFKSIQRLTEETAAEGKDVYSIDGREWARVVGIEPNTVVTQYHSHGEDINFSGKGDFLEIVGYFNDFNTLMFTWNNRNADINVSIDGILTIVGNTKLSGDTTLGANPKGGHHRDPHSVINAGLPSSTSLHSTTLGLHTLRYEIRDASLQTNCSGIDLIAQDTQNITATNATNILTSAGHTLSNGDEVILTGSDLPNGLSAATRYFVVGASGSNFQVSGTSGGSAVTFSDDGTGARTFTALNNIQIPAQNVVSYGKKFSISATATHYDPFTSMTYGGSGINASTLGGLIDTATSLGMENWKAGTANYHRPWNGGRVVKWIASDGTIKTSVTMMPPNAQNAGGTAIAEVSNAHIIAGTNDDIVNMNNGGTNANELCEVATTKFWREFGNGAGNAGAGTAAGARADLSMLENPEDDVGYVLSDGLTSIFAKDTSAHTTYRDWYTGDGDPIYITFIGSGISMNHGYSYSGAQAGTTNGVHAINLPYGTHVLKYERSGSSINLTISEHTIKTGISTTAYMGGKDISFHQPKMPPIPEDACIIADYMLMADFVRCNGGPEKVSKGCRRIDPQWEVYIESDGSPSFAGLADVYDSHMPGYVTILHSSTNRHGEIAYFGKEFLSHTYSTEQTGLKLDGTIAAHSATVAGTNQTSLYPNTQASTLGIHKAQMYSIDSKAHLSFQGFDVQCPIHTSSHYQDFETPYLKEPAAGDRNMEQTNLICSADGKTWDQVTRDTSYVSNVVAAFNRTNNTASSSGAQWIVDEVRGTEEGKTLFQKDWTVAYHAVYCLRSGWYQIDWSQHTSTTHCDMYKNETMVHRMHSHPGNASTSVTTAVYFQRGDYLKLVGGYSGNSGDEKYTNFQITRIEK